MRYGLAFLMSTLLFSSAAVSSEFDEEEPMVVEVEVPVGAVCVEYRPIYEYRTIWMPTPKGNSKRLKAFFMERLIRAGRSGWIQERPLPGDVVRNYRDQPVPGREFIFSRYRLVCTAAKKVQ